MAIYLAGPDTLEALKLEAHNADAVHITAHLDWRTFSADRAESYILTPDGGRRLQAEFTLDAAAQMLALSRYPAHTYNFDFISLNVILRHWTDPETALTFGVLQPVFAPDPPALMRDEGPATLRYTGRAARGGQPCRAYTLGGSGLGNLTGRAATFKTWSCPCPTTPIGRASSSSGWRAPRSARPAGRRTWPRPCAR